MTREHKLALIVGFSLILLVGVLISDHLSRARQAQVGPVTTHEAQVGEANFPSPIDPIKAIENAPRPANVPPLAPERTLAGGGVPERSGPVVGGGGGFVPAEPGQTGPLAGLLNEGADRAPAPDPAGPAAPAEPRRTAMKMPTREMIVGRQDADQELIRTVLASGGRVREQDGVIVITPPALVQAGEERGRAGPEMASLPPPARPDPGAAAALKTYTIQKGDNLSTLAAKEYGDGKLWAKLAKFNGITDEDGVVRLGQSIKLPPRDVLLGKPAAPAPGGTPRPLARPGAASPRTALAAKEGPKNKTLATNEPALTVTVKKGETLGEIAKRTLGSAKRWPELAEFNKIEDEDHIAAGTVLKVPPMRG